MNTSLKKLINQFFLSQNHELAISMSQYMRNQFSFLGIQSPQRKLLQKDFLNIQKTEKDICWHYIDSLYTLDKREFQYVAIDYLKVSLEKLNDSDFYNIEKYIKWKSWWDSVDNLSTLIGRLIKRYSYLEEHITKYCVVDPNIWIRRMSIIYQLQYKQETDTDILSYAIVMNTNSDEFFINKAIGWALREYSKYNPQWVCSFLSRNKDILHPLSIREAKKYIVKQISPPPSKYITSNTE